MIVRPGSILGAGIGLALLVLAGILNFSSKIENWAEEILEAKMKITEDNPEMVHYWTYFPYDISVDFYLWNITNPDEIIKNGEKPKLEQVGPFSYSEVIERRNITFGNGTVEYSNYQLYKEKDSIPDPNAKVYNLNGPFFVIMNELRTFPFWVQNLISTFMKSNSYGPIIEKSAREFIWGYEDPLLSVLSQIIPDVIPSSKFGFFLMQNDTNSKVYQARDGTGDVRRWMEINEYDGLDHLNVWNTKYGNMINGTDGYGFAPFSESPPDIFIDLLCRSFHLSLPAENSQRKSHTKTKFILSWDTFATPEEVPDNIDFCVGGQCPKAGLLNLTECTRTQFGVSIPLVVSFPYLCNVDSSILDEIELRTSCPSNFKNIETENSIETYVKMDTDTGLVYEAKKQMQLNMFIQENLIKRTMAEDTSLSWEGYLERKESIGSTENDQIIIPIMWFKQTARMQWSFYKKMLLSAIIPLKILLNSNLILYIVSLLIIFFTVPFISKRTSSQYQPLSEVDPSSEDSEAPEELPGLESSIPEEN